MQCFVKEPFGRFCIARFAEQELERVPMRVDCPIEVHPLLFDLDVRFIDAPGVVGDLEVWPASLLQFWGIPLNPPIDRAMINMQTVFGHHLFQVSVAQRIDT